MSFILARPPLTRESIISAAIELAEEEGLEGLSFRKLASRLRITPMALYRHISHKRELEGLVAAHIIETTARSFQ